VKKNGETGKEKIQKSSRGANAGSNNRTNSKRDDTEALGHNSDESEESDSEEDSMVAYTNQVVDKNKLLKEKVRKLRAKLIALQEDAGSDISESEAAGDSDNAAESEGADGAEAE
jgi:hypothetical protein